MTHRGNCSIPGCLHPVSASLEVRAFCREHFIQACYEQVDLYMRWLEENRYSDTTSEAVRHFLSECSRQVTELAHGEKGLDNLERARLLDILLRTVEMGQQLRRSSRVLVEEAIRLRCEKLGRYWEEETVTRVLSLHGAAVACAHPVEKGDILQVKRNKTGREARARVAWCQRKNGRSEIGIEFLDSENFWEIGRSAANPASPSDHTLSLSAT